MSSIPASVKRQISDPAPDVTQFLGVVTGKAKPQRVHLAELFADEEIMQWITENVLNKKWVPAPPSGVCADQAQARQHLLCEIEYWYRMGYDYIRVSGGLGFQGQGAPADNTARLAQQARHWTNEHSGPIQSWADFEAYPWPQVKPDDFWMYHFVAEHLPEGMGMLICPQSGFFEIPLNMLIGYESMALMMYDQPDLLTAVFERVRDLVVQAYMLLLDVEPVVGCFQGDDMGFKTSTLMPPDFLKQYSLPGHKQVAQLAHQRGKVYFLHACGNVEEIMDYLIDEILIDAKHSFEDVIMPIEQVYDKYASRIGLLGGVDVDLLAGADEATVRRRTCKIIEHCVPDGRFALGSGNTIANYCRPENVLAMFDQAYRWAR